MEKFEECYFAVTKAEETSTLLRCSCIGVESKPRISFTVSL